VHYIGIEGGEMTTLLSNLWNREEECGMLRRL